MSVPPPKVAAVLSVLSEFTEIMKTGAPDHNEGSRSEHCLFCQMSNEFNDEAIRSELFNYMQMLLEMKYGEVWLMMETMNQTSNLMSHCLMVGYTIGIRQTAGGSIPGVKVD